MCTVAKLVWRAAEPNWQTAGCSRFQRKQRPISPFRIELEHVFDTSNQEKKKTKNANQSTHPKQNKERRALCKQRLRLVACIAGCDDLPQSLCPGLFSSEDFRRDPVACIGWWFVTLAAWEVGFQLAIFSRYVVYAYSRAPDLECVASAGLAGSACMQLVLHDSDFAIFSEFFCLI